MMNRGHRPFQLALASVALWGVSALLAPSSAFALPLRANFRLFGEVLRLNFLAFGSLEIKVVLDDAEIARGRVDYQVSTAPVATGLLGGIAFPDSSDGFRAIEHEFSVPLDLQPGETARLGVRVDASAIRLVLDFFDDVFYVGSVLGSTPGQGLVLESVTLADGTPLAEAGLRFEIIQETSLLSVLATNGANVQQQTVMPPAVAQASALPGQPGSTETAPGYARASATGNPLLSLALAPEPNPLVADQAHAWFDHSGMNPTVRLVFDAPAVSADYMEYKVKESDRKALDGALAKGCNVALDDPVFDFGDGLSTKESFEIGRVVALGLPANETGAGSVDLAGTHFLSFAAKPSKLSALPGVSGRFRKGRKHPKRVGVLLKTSSPTLHDGSGENTIAVDVGPISRLLVPASKGLSTMPDPPPSGRDYYQCYRVGASKSPPFGTLQDPATGRVLENLQVRAEDQFGDGGGHPLFGDSRLYDLSNVAELCNPTAVGLLDTEEQDVKGRTRTTSCVVPPSPVARPEQSLLCWSVKLSTKVIPQPWDGSAKGTKIVPKQNAHEKLTLKKGSALFVAHVFGAPTRLDTMTQRRFCLPVEVLERGTIRP